jgi:uncharacterized repeat protein (TIGR01451 family)
MFLGLGRHQARRARRYPLLNRPDGPHRRGRAHRSRSRSAALVLPLALLLAGALAPAARAEEAHNTVTFSCSSVTFSYFDFPNANNNTVTEIVRVDGVEVVNKKFTFNGPTATDKVTVSVPPGHHTIDGQTHWKTNGVTGGADIKGKNGVTCGPESEFTIEKLQKILPTKTYSTATLTSGKVGQKIEYEIIVKNTGNLALTFSEFTDAVCDGGTIMGGPGAKEVQPNESTTYTCSHVITEADRTAGSVTNTATVTGTPKEGPGPTTHQSNPVVVEVPDPGNTVGFSCSSVTFNFTGFPNVKNNTVVEIVRVDGKVVYKQPFVFNGPSASNTVTVSLGPGHHTIDGQTHWKTNGFKGGKDIKAKGGITCAAPEPGFSIEKKEEIEGSGSGFTSGPLTGKVGERVLYEIIVTNTGTTPLTFSGFTDANCENLAGGPGANPVEPGKSSTYTCNHVLAVGSNSNSATDTGTPPEGDGPPITHESNTVDANVAAEPGFSIEKLQEIAGSGKGFTTEELKGERTQTIDYEIVVKNTGNVPLTFSGGFADANCENVGGGPGASPVEPGSSTTYTCEHTLVEADELAGFYSNNATDEGTPPVGEGSPVSHTSNTVVVEVTPFV